MLDGDVSDVVLDATTPHLGGTAVRADQVQRFDERYHAVEDVEWWLRTAAVSRVSTVAEIGCELRRHPGARLQRHRRRRTPRRQPRPARRARRLVRRAPPGRGLPPGPHGPARRCRSATGATPATCCSMSLRRRPSGLAAQEPAAHLPALSSRPLGGAPRGATGAGVRSRTAPSRAPRVPHRTGNPARRPPRTRASEPNRAVDPACGDLHGAHPVREDDPAPVEDHRRLRRPRSRPRLRQQHRGPEEARRDHLLAGHLHALLRRQRRHATRAAPYTQLGQMGLLATGGRRARPRSPRTVGSTPRRCPPGSPPRPTPPRARSRSRPPARTPRTPSPWPTRSATG